MSFLLILPGLIAPLCSYSATENADSLEQAVSWHASNGQNAEGMLSLLIMAQNSYDMGDYKLAYNELKIHSERKDSMFKLEKERVLAELKQYYENEEDQASILRLEKDGLKKKIQRNSLFYSILGLIMVSLYGFLIFRHKLSKTKMLSEQKIIQLEKEQKLMTARNVVEGQEEERKRIATELHDGLGVILSATKMQFSAVRCNDSNDLKIVDKAIRLIEQANSEVRRISHNMMPGLLTKLGIYEALEELFENLVDCKEINARLEIEGDRRRLSENNEIMIYRIIQEMVNNTLKYGNASNIDLIIIISELKLTIHYSEDGNGFNLEKLIASGYKSIGLKSIESRVGFLNGSVSLETSPGKGVDYLIMMPV
jgi:two-component system, NarL family, sensor kinase